MSRHLSGLTRKSSAPADPLYMAVAKEKNEAYVVFLGVLIIDPIRSNLKINGLGMSLIFFLSESNRVGFGST
jgi:hypothetical protein